MTLDTETPEQSSPFETQFSPDRLHRYTLHRNIRQIGGGMINFLCLNPSTADEKQDDPTVRRCINWASLWGFDDLIVTNIFAYRATDPTEMKRAIDPVGPANDHWIDYTANLARVVVCGWGNHGSHRGRSVEVLKMLRKYDEKIHCLRLTGAMEPNHPLYLPTAIRPQKIVFKA